MDSPGSRAIGGSQGNSGGTARKQRSYLFLSMMLLVWNALATCFIAPLVPVPGSAPIPINIDARGLRDAPGDSLRQDASPREGPLSVRQKYLIGKRVDINTSSKEEINELPGISDAMAEAIVKERERIGGFRSTKDLLGVKGIKEKRLKKILPFLVKMENN